MSYRDEEEALRNRVENLEEDLRDRDRERAENEALRKRVAELERAEREQAERERAEHERLAAAAPVDPAVPRRVERAPPITRPAPVELSGKWAGGCWVVALPVVSLLLMINGPSWLPFETAPIGWLACPSAVIGATLQQTNSQRGQSWNILCRMPTGDTVAASPTLEIFGSILFGFVPLLVAAAVWRAWPKRAGAKR